MGIGSYTDNDRLFPLVDGVESGHYPAEEEELEVVKDETSLLLSLAGKFL